MIAFIDEKTGNPYKVDPGQIFYFDDLQSIGLYYQKRLFVVSDKREIKVTLPSKDIFFIYKPTITPDTEIDTITVKEQSYTGELIEGKSNRYLYYINIGCKSDEIGTFTEDITIDGTVYKISADFWGQQENLEILLKNQGFNIPYDFTRAMYDTNVHTIGTIDWITVNRKFKELLINSINILYKKGSYRSLIDSFDWFEWGKIARLHEYWNDSLVKYYDRALSIDYNDIVKDLMEVYHKSTFISINVPLKEEKVDSSGHVEYEELESGERTIPLLQDITMKWSRDDIMLKLTLLGNYYSTFFMPLHLNLLFSSVENRVMNALLGKTLVSRIDRKDKQDISHRGDTLLCNNINKVYYIGDVQCRSKDIVIGIDKIDGGKEENIYLGRGVLIKLDLSVQNAFDDTLQNDYNKLIVKGTEVPVKIDDDGNVILNTKNGGDIYVFINKEGTYTLGINLFSDSGSPLMTTFTVEVKDTIITQPRFNIYHLTKMTQDEINTKKGEGFKDDSTFQLAFTTELERENNFHNFYYPVSLKNRISCCLFNTSSESGKYIDTNLCTDCGDCVESCGMGAINLETHEIDNTLCQECGTCTANCPTGAITDGNGLYLFKNDETAGVLYKTIEDLENALGNNYLLLEKPLSNGNKVVYLVELYDGDTYTVQLNKIRGDDTKYNTDGTLQWSVFYRFLPFLFKKESYEVPQELEGSDNCLFEFVPLNKYIKITEDSSDKWTIINERTREESIIEHQIQPIVWCNNVEGTNKSGMYSMTLSQNGGEYTRKCFVKVV